MTDVEKVRKIRRRVQMYQNLGRYTTRHDRLLARFYLWLTDKPKYR